MCIRDRPQTDAPSFDATLIAAANFQSSPADLVEPQASHGDTAVAVAPALDATAKGNPSSHAPADGGSARRDLFELRRLRESAGVLDDGSSDHAIGGSSEALAGISRTNQSERQGPLCCVAARPGEIGCTDLECAFSICKEQPSCCTTHWSSRCVEAAVANCHVCEDARPQASRR